MSTIYIIWLRQLKRYWRSKSRIIGSIGQPLLFLIALGFGLGPVYSKAGQGDYIQFLAPGVMSQAILFMGVFSGIELIWDRQFGFLKETLVAPVPRLHIMLGKTIGGATIAAVQGMIVFILSLFVGFRPENWLILPLAFMIMFMIAFLFTSLGIAIASTMEEFHGFQLIMNFLVMPTYFLSGAIFPLESAPRVMKQIALINPLSYGVHALRIIFSGQSLLMIMTDSIVLLIIASIFSVIGARLFSKVQI